MSVKDIIGLSILSENNKLQQEISDQQVSNLERDLKAQDAEKLNHIKEMTNLEARKRAREDREYYERRIKELESQANPAGLDASYLNELSRLKKQLKEVNEVIKEKDSEVEYYKNLLSKPMLEIAEKNGQFKEMYLQEQALLAQWIVSQRAFKEIAMTYGKELGKTTEDVLQESEIAKEKVITGKSELNNNVDQNVVNNLDYEAGKKQREENKKKQIEDAKRKANENIENALAEALKRKKQKEIS